MNIDEEFKIIKEFVDTGEALFKKPGKKAKYKYGDKKHLESLKQSFLRGRNTKINISEPETITDEALWEYIKLKKKLTDDKVNELSKYHKIAMSIETKIGSLLEGFIFKYISKHDWIWCSGNILQDIDFIKKDIDENQNITWVLLQVKNSDNSENSASARVRVGTNIIKWYRRFSKIKDKDNWSELVKIVKENDKDLIQNLSEKNYVKYLKS